MLLFYISLQVIKQPLTMLDANVILNGAYTTYICYLFILHLFELNVCTFCLSVLVFNVPFLCVF